MNEYQRRMRESGRLYRWLLNHCNDGDEVAFFWTLFLALAHELDVLVYREEARGE